MCRVARPLGNVHGAPTDVDSAPIAPILPSAAHSVPPRTPPRIEQLSPSGAATPAFLGSALRYHRHPSRPGIAGRHRST